MSAIWQFLSAIRVVLDGFLWVLFLSSFFQSICFGMALFSKRERNQIKDSNPAMILFLIGCAIITGFFLWKIHGETISNWFLTSPGMFGKSIGGYEQKFLDEQHPPKMQGDKLVDCWEWRHRNEDGVYVVPIKVSKPLGYFSEYHLHLLPISKRSFLISGNRFYSTKDDYNEVKNLLTSKYGKPTEEKEDTCSFEDGDKKIGLVFTNILGGKPQLYINAYRTDLLEKDLPEELKKLEAQRKDNKIESL